MLYNQENEKGEEKLKKNLQRADRQASHFFA